MIKGFKQFTEFIGDFIIPTRLRQPAINTLRRAGISEVPYYSYGLLVYILCLLSVITVAWLAMSEIFSNVPKPILIGISFILIPICFLLLLVITVAIYYYILKAKISQKTRSMEEAMPDFLDELSLNLKSGQTLEKALANSTEPRFGHLTEEIQSICKKVNLGMDLADAVKEFTDNYDSEIISETFNLIIIAWRKGTRTTIVVDRIFENLQLTRHLRKKVVASVTNYQIFLTFVTIVIAPVMFALAYHLIALVRAITSKIHVYTTRVSIPMLKIEEVRINDSDFILFSYLTLVLVSMFSATIISIIKTGTIEEGYKQIVILSALTIIAYKLSLEAFAIVFKNFLSV